MLLLGVRRIEAITGQAAKNYFEKIDADFNKIKSTLKQTGNPVKAINHLQEESLSLHKQIDKLLKEKALQIKEQFKQKITVINDINFLATKVDLDANGIKTLAFELGQEFDNLFFLAAADVNSKAILSLYISKSLVETRQLDAGKIIRELSKNIQGGGGGQAFFATAGGKNPSGINQALKQAKRYIE